MDHDRLFKELLRNFFVEFLELFAPALARELRGSRLEFLDKEVFTDVASGGRHEVDLLVRANFRGRPAFFLVHVENQSAPAANFAGRMFRYFARLYEKHGLPVYPIALFSYDAPRRSEPNRHSVRFPDLDVLNFRFRSVQLNRLDWRRFLKKPNPVASALMAKMRILPADRPRVKLECLRMLVTLKLNPAKATLIGTFMHSYLKLTAAETIVYNREVEKIAPRQKEEVMRYTNEWIEKGRAEGLKEGQLKGQKRGWRKGVREGRQEGRQEGLAEGQRGMVMRLLERRLGAIPADLTERVNELSVPQLEELAEAVAIFKSVADARRWLVKNT